MPTSHHSAAVESPPATTGSAIDAATTREAPTTDVGGTSSQRPEYSDAGVPQQPAIEPQGEVAEAAVVAERKPAAPASDPVRDHPAEGHSAGADGEAETAAFDPAAFDEALRQVLSSTGGELLFRFSEETAAGDKIAAVRLGDGDARMVALVILPAHGAPLRVEPIEESANPLAPLAESYASLVDAWKAAA